MEKAVTGIFIGVILLVIGFTLLLSQAPTIHDLSNTAAGKTLENVSSNAKTLYNLTDFVWAGASLVFIVLGGFGVAMGIKSAVS